MDNNELQSLSDKLDNIELELGSIKQSLDLIRDLNIKLVEILKDK